MAEEYVSYESFARVYDELMDNVPYDEWAAFFVEKLKKYGIDSGLVCDLGCGTGNMTARLRESGYDMIGVDSSDEMLAIAREKQICEGGNDILYLLQDMRQFELYGTVRACVSTCDCMNYMLEEEDFLAVCRLVNNYLDPKGIFVFDFNTEYKYREVLGDTVIAENREDCSFIWENYYDSEENINEYDLTIFVEKQQDLFQKFTETHFQRGYSLAEVKKLVQSAGLELLEAIDMDTKGAPAQKSERICVIARESGK